MPRRLRFALMISTALAASCGSSKSGPDLSTENGLARVLSNGSKWCAHEDACGINSQEACLLTWVSLGDAKAEVAQNKVTASAREACGKVLAALEDCFVQSSCDDARAYAKDEPSPCDDEDRDFHTACEPLDVAATHRTAVTTADAGVPDAGSPDAGSPDAGPLDAGGVQIGEPVDLNGDGIPDGIAVDVTGDGVADGVDTNGDGTPDVPLPGETEAGSGLPRPGQLVDVNGDGSPDGAAVDTNGDGVADAIDVNGDGVGDLDLSGKPLVKGSSADAGA